MPQEMSCDLFRKKQQLLEEGGTLRIQDTSRNGTHYLTTTCTFLKPASKATTDTFTAVVTMFSNFHNSLADVMYGTNVSVLVTLCKSCCVIDR
ncbi:hypothetical protein Bpfe_014925 [Biomphalaria pfeifferi]|uniref:Uncharacterized protein n=1 Tax=Biomphalaria pfeifferi TaxID=112525 RepID=A0AAD8BL87_BIOPF|nr:hypothetical protein Bpfe_014925 [Biomphalaria pfeifferi]